jgi:hypothetical protein
MSSVALGSRSGATEARPTEARPTKAYIASKAAPHALEHRVGVGLVVSVCERTHSPRCVDELYSPRLTKTTGGVA